MVTVRGLCNFSNTVYWSDAAVFRVAVVCSRVHGCIVTHCVCAKLKTVACAKLTTVTRAMLFTVAMLSYQWLRVLSC